MHAIIEDSGTQIKVSAGDVIDIDRRDLDGTTLTFDRVLLLSAGDAAAATIGTPYVQGASVTAEVVTEREKKIDVVKFKRRKGYRVKTGHRQPFLRVKITGIQS